MPNGISDFELALTGLISATEGFQRGRQQRRRFQERMAARQERRRAQRVSELTRLGAPLEQIEAGEIISRAAPGAAMGPEERAALESFRRFQKRQARTGAIFDPTTGAFREVPAGTKIARSPLRDLPTPSLVSRINSLERRSQTLSDRDRLRLQAFQTELDRRGGIELPEPEPEPAPAPTRTERFRELLRGARTLFGGERRAETPPERQSIPGLRVR